MVEIVNDDIEIRDIGFKGKGLFARRNIQPGLRILAEKPLLKGTLDDSDGLVKSFRNLSRANQEAFLNLKRSAKTTNDNFDEGHRAIILDVFKSNSFTFQIGSRNLVVLLYGSRFNHSCVPNIYWHYNEQTGVTTFQALDKILAGDELTISYIGLHNRTSELRQMRLGKWRFRCVCPEACEETPDNDENDRRRGTLSDLEDELQSIVGNRYGEKTNIDWRKAVETVVAMIRYQDQLRLHSALENSLHYGTAFLIQLRETELALRWAEEDEKLLKMMVGADSVWYKRLTGAISELKDAVEQKVPVQGIFSNYYFKTWLD